MIIQPATPNDCEACLAISKDDGKDYWTKEDFQKIIHDPHAVLLVAKDNDELVGYIVGFIVPTKQNEGAIHETHVAINHRRKKIGTALVQALTEEFKQRGATVVVAFADQQYCPFYVNSCQFEKKREWTEVKKELP